MNVGLLVEGHGEFYAGPILVRRIAGSLGAHCVVRSVIRQPRSTIIKPGELERAVTLLGNKVGDGGLRARTGAPEQGHDRASRPANRRRARSARIRSMVPRGGRLAAWSARPSRRPRSPATPEVIRDAKGWLGDRMPRGYSPTADQPALTELFDLELARKSPSFDKLVRELTRLLTATET
jgi:hypothetical protein